MISEAVDASNGKKDADVTLNEDGVRDGDKLADPSIILNEFA